MAVQYGKTALQALKSFRSKEWFSKSFIRLGADVASKYAGRNEVLHGCLVTTGNASGSQLNLKISAGEIMLGGIMMNVTAVSGNTTNWLSAGSNILEPLWSDGTAGGTDYTSVSTAFDTSGANTYYMTLIALNSDGAKGGQTTNAAPDGLEAKFAIIINGSSNAALGTDKLSSKDIDIALSLSTGNSNSGDHRMDHADHPNPGWVRIADIVATSSNWTITSNRNNHAGL
tara:strand:+ start:8787 stop:9473 length:687 start_codon:yes stop_codon:yes gene_type:complete